MSEADKIFELFGFVKDDSEDKIVYSSTGRKYKKRIVFLKEYQLFYCSGSRDKFHYITTCELEAINAKVKELGWLDKE